MTRKASSEAYICAVATEDASGCHTAKQIERCCRNVIKVVSLLQYIGQDTESSGGAIYALKGKVDVSKIFPKQNNTDATRPLYHEFNSLPKLTEIKADNESLA